MVTVALVGDVDLTGVAALDRAVAAVARAAPSTLYVDLSGTEFAGSALLTFLVAVRGAIGGRARLVLSGPSPLIRHLVEITGVDSLLTFEVGADAGRGPSR